MEKDTLYKFFNGQASKKEKEEIRQWLESSSDHKKEFLSERKFFDAMILLGPTQAIKRQKRIGYQTVWLEFIKIAAVFILVASCGIYFHQSEIKKLSTAMNTITVPPGQRVNLTLPDGTNVWLNARSQLKYPAVFVGNKREISLNGEAYFDVTPNKQSPFIVNTNKCIIKVLGTKFNVDAYNDSKDFSTSLIEGSVQVSDKKDPSKKAILSPNQIVTLKKDKLLTSTISDHDILRWKEGLICFKNLKFQQLMSRFEKCFGVQINVQNKNLVHYVCSGKFRISDGVDNALRILQKDAKFKFERDNEKSTIYIK